MGVNEASSPTVILLDHSNGATGKRGLISLFCMSKNGLQPIIPDEWQDSKLGEI